MTKSRILVSPIRHSATSYPDFYSYVIFPLPLSFYHKLKPINLRKMRTSLLTSKHPPPGRVEIPLGISTFIHYSNDASYRHKPIAK